MQKDSIIDKEQRDKLIDELLLFMNNEIEQEGNIIGHISFNFNEDGEDALNLLDKIKISYENLQSILKICITRNYLKYRTMGGGQFGSLCITEEGQGRAISTEQAKHNMPVAGSNIQIGTLNSHGNTQIGDYNSQNVVNVFNHLIEKIDASDASAEEKNEAKQLLSKFIAHPLVNTVLGTSASVLSSVGL